MRASQRAIDTVIAQAAKGRAAFALETVFSHWAVQADGSVESKLDLIHYLHGEGYFVLLLFVGLADVGLSQARVHARALEGGHPVAQHRLIERFSRTQLAVKNALVVADAAVLFDNSRSPRTAFTPVHIRRKEQVLFDVRRSVDPPAPILRWLDVVAPEGA